MGRWTWTARGIPERDRLEVFRSGNLDAFGALVDPLHGPERPVDWHIEGAGSHGFQHIRLRSSAAVAQRGTAQLARRSLDSVLVYRCHSPQVYTAGRFTLDFAPGDIGIADGNEAWHMRPAGDVAFEVFHLPRALVAPVLRQGPHGMLRLPPGQGVGTLVTALLRALAEAPEDLPALAVASTIEHAARLLAIAGGEPAAAHAEAVAAAQLARLHRFVEQRLHDPALSPATVAAAHRISVRRLHLLFEPTGTTFSVHLRRRRLERCRAALEDAAQAHRSVADIAFAHGFESLATFYRAFAAAFGAAPGELRRAALMHRRERG